MELRNRRILITGAAGFIGSHLAERLAAENELVLVDDFSVGPRENLSALERRSNVRIEESDITNPGAMRDLMEGIEVVFHLAISCLRTSLNRPYLSHDINAGGTLSVCLAARDHGVARLIYVSSSEVYGSAEQVPMSESHICRPTTVYGASKLAGEHYALACLRTYGLPVSVVRPFNTYGPREPYAGARAEVIPRFLLQLEQGESPVVYGHGRQTRDFTFVEDTVRGITAAARCDALIGDAVNVAYGQEVSIRTVAETLRRLLGREDLEIMYVDPRPGDVARHWADVGKAKRLLGYEPSMDLSTGLERTVAWFREQGIVDRVDPGSTGRPNW